MTAERLTGESPDPVLGPFLNAPLESAEEHDALGVLIDQVTPVIEGVIHGKAGAVVPEIERRELFSEAVLQVIRKLQEVKSGPPRQPITNFKGYAAVTAFHVVHAHFRRVHPERRRLRNRIRHVVRTSAPFALWQSQSGTFVCGRAGWAGTVSEECSEGDLEIIPPLSPALSVTWNDSVGRPQIARALGHVFDHVQKPVELERLVETVAELFRLPMTPTQSTPIQRPDQSESQRTAASDRADETASIELSLVYRSALHEVWREVDQLPPRQRMALLLGLRDENGSAVASLLILLGIVTFEALAAAVELSSEELTAIWDQLPLPDLVISERLGLTRQQVINLRKSARDRLGRRLPFLRQGNPLLDRASS
jgi:DNA-directed RNA polymerase specialized sigma24 family protein